MAAQSEANTLKTGDSEHMRSMKVKVDILLFLSSLVDFIHALHYIRPAGLLSVPGCVNDPTLHNHRDVTFRREEVKDIICKLVLFFVRETGAWDSPAVIKPATSSGIDT
jgi:hypothetical protein